MGRAQFVACVLVLTGAWLWGGASPCGGAALMVEKNLFAPDRKPPSPEATAPSPQANKPGLTAKAVQLDGVFIRGDTKKAIIRVKGQVPGADKTKPQNPYVSVKEGEKIGDLQVVKIDTRSVSLEKDGQVEVIKLFAEGKVVPPPPPMPAAAGGAPGQAPAPGEVAKGQAQPGGQQSPAMAPPGAPGPGGRMPGVGPGSGAPNAPGSQRNLQPPAQHSDEDEGVTEEEASADEGAEESGG